jgi:hypothetical protein
VNEDARDWRQTGDETPPLRVRLAFRMRFPVPRQWRPWAYAKIIERYGDDPTMEGAPFTYPAQGSEIRMARRRSPWQRRQGLLWANKLKSDGTPLEDRKDMFDRMSDEWIGLFPFLFLGGCLLVVVVTTVVALHFV